jgi:hypothetical protein
MIRILLASKTINRAYHKVILNVPTHHRTTHNEARALLFFHGSAIIFFKLILVRHNFGANGFEAATESHPTVTWRRVLNALP